MSPGEDLLPALPGFTHAEPTAQAGSCSSGCGDDAMGASAGVGDKHRHS